MKNITYTDKAGNKWDYSIPFSIKCTISGVEKTYTSEEYINGKIERFGGLDKLRANYISRDAKKAAKAAGTPVKEIKLEIESKTELPAPGSMLVKTEKPTPMTKEQAPTDTCMNPKFFLDHNKTCTGCALVSLCNFKDSPKGKLLSRRK